MPRTKIVNPLAKFLQVESQLAQAVGFVDPKQVRHEGTTQHANHGNDAKYFSDVDTFSLAAHLILPYRR